MTRLALITKYFYPSTRMAAKRTVNLSRYLNERAGLTVDVLTESLNREGAVGGDFPLDLRRVRYLPPSRTEFENGLFRERTAFHKFLAKTLFWKRIEGGFAAAIERSGLAASYDAFYFSLPPFAPLLKLACRLKCRYPEKKVILEYRDEWIGGAVAYAERNRLIHHYHVPKGLYRQALYHLENRGGKRLEREALRAADLIVVVGRQFRDDLLRRVDGLDGDRIVWIPNGIADDEIEELDRLRQEAAAPAGPALSLIYAGSLFGTQDIRPLVRAVNGLVERGRIRRGDIRIDLYGHHEQHREDWPASLKQAVEFRGCAPRREILRQYFLHDLVVFLIGDWPKANTIVTGKIYELIESGRPLFALLPLNQGGDAREIIEKTDAGFLVDIRDEAKIADALIDLLGKKREGRILARPRRNLNWFHQRYHYRHLCRALSEHILK